MLLDRKILKLVGATEGTSNPLLQGILIEPDGSGVATNGYLLVKYTPIEKLNPKDFPETSGVDPDDNGAVLEPFTLPVDIALKIDKTIGNPAQTMPIMSAVALDVAKTNKNGHAVLAVTDLQNQQVFKAQKGTDFPKYGALFPNGKPVTTIGLSVENWKRVMDVMKKLGVKFFSMEIRNPLDTLVIYGKSENGKGRVKALVMPAHVDKLPEKEKPQPSPEPEPEPAQAIEEEQKAPVVKKAKKKKVEAVEAPKPAKQKKKSKGGPEFTVNQLVVIRGALHESIKVARGVPNGTTTLVYKETREAYRKVIEQLIALQPGRIRKAYKDGKGDVAHIMGHTKHNKEWVWSVQGNWYEQSTGKYINSREIKGGYVGGKQRELIIESYVMDHASPYDLVEELPAEAAWFEGIKTEES